MTPTPMNAEGYQMPQAVDKGAYGVAVSALSGAFMLPCCVLAPLSRSRCQFADPLEWFLTRFVHAWCEQASPKGMNADLPFIRPEEQDHFKKLLEEVDESELSKEEIAEREIMSLILRVK